MRLFRAELSRFFARRFTRVMIVTMVAALGVVAVVNAVNTHRPTAAEVRTAETQATQDRQTCETDLANIEGEVPRGVNCDHITASNYLPYILDFQSEIFSLFLLFAGFLALFGYLVGASFVGAEWSSGGVANLLLWRPKRLSVLSGKLLAALVAVLLIGLVFGAAWVGGIWLIARYRGSIDGLDQQFWLDFAATSGRGIGFALFATTVGAAIASLGRRTAAALGGLIGYLVVIELGARLVLMALRVPMFEQYLLSSYISALLTNQHEIIDWQSCLSGWCKPGLVLRWWHGTLALAAVTVVTVLLAAVSIRRRDIT